MKLVCPECRGDVDSLPPRTPQSPRRFRHADDDTILCLALQDGEMVPVSPVYAA